MKILIKASLFFAVILAGVSCKMDLNSTSTIPIENPKDVFKTYSDAERLANGMSTDFRSTQYGIYAYTTEVQADMFNASVDFGNRNGPPHTMSVGFTTSDYSVKDVWNGYYNAIMDYNFFIDGVHYVSKTTTNTDLSSAQIAKINAWKGNAYFFRAMTYHNLVKLYAKDYEPSTANTELGVPLVLKYDVSAKPARATLAASYTQITKDLDSAARFLAQVPGAVRSIVPTIDVVNALKARVQLSMHDYAGAAVTAGALITSGKYTLASTAAALAQEWNTDNGPEDLMQMTATLTEYGQANSIWMGAYYGNMKAGSDVYFTYTPDFFPTLTLLELYGNTDLRFDAYFASNKYASFVGGSGYFAWMFIKYEGNPALRNTIYPSTFLQKAKIFRIAEMYLIKAEAEAMLGQTGAAQVTLNALQTARKGLLTNGSMEAVQREWAIETVGEGFRVECLKRWKLGFKNRVPFAPVLVVPGNGYTEIDIPAGYYKLTWPIPANDINTNPNLVQNPGWTGEK